MNIFDRSLPFKISPSVAFAVAFAGVGLIVVPFTRDSTHAFRSAPSTEVLQRLAHQEEERLLQEKKAELLAAKIVEGLAPRFDRLLSQNTEPKENAQAEQTLAAASLNRELAEETKEVQKLREEVKGLLKYVKEVERSISFIDTAASTPHVLKQKIEH